MQELIQLSDDLRHFILDVVSNNEGHLGANLGVIELTIALHYVYNTPYDKIVWDVGHQAYGHKILTGRKYLFATNRKYKGISGFPKMEESEYDAFGGGHASVSISAALGMAVASKIKKEQRHVVAVIGDGSLTGGLAFEGLNNAGLQQHSDLLVILNDNNIAIDPGVGALHKYLIDITTSKTYNKIKTDVWNILGTLKKLGNPQRLIQKLLIAIKSLFFRQGNFFESLGFRYFGPVDGHNLPQLIKILNQIKDIEGPKLLHIVTKKGKGYPYAEENQTLWHSPGKFDKATGKRIKNETDAEDAPLYQDVFGNTLLELARMNEKIVGITPAMPSGCSMNIMMKEMPERVFDVGIAESHAVTYSAGLATQGLIPFCNIYSSFMQRAYDQVIHDVAIQKLQVVLCIDRAGLVGSDGATHHGAFDIAYLRCIPHITIAAPMNEIELRNMMYSAQLPGKGPYAIRYPKGKGVCKQWKQPFEEVERGRGRIVKEGTDIAVLSIGHVGNNALAAINMLNKHLHNKVALYDMRFVKPLDEKLLHRIFSSFRNIITIEDGVITGGFGTAILEFMNQHSYHAKITILGIPDRFIEHGSNEELTAECGYSINDIYKMLLSLITSSSTVHVN